MRLEMPRELEDEIYRCFRCGFCRQACPTFTIMGSESWNARGRLMLARSVLEGSAEVDPRLLDRIYSCTSCSACEVVCPAVVRIVDALQAFKEGLISTGVEPPGRISELAEAIVEKGNPFGRVGGYEVEGSGDLLIFTGCVASELEPCILDALERILEEAGIAYSILRGACCGAPLLRFGMRAEAEKVARRVAEALRASGAREVITPCPSCLEMLDRSVKPLVGQDIRLRHTSSFLRGLLKEGKLEVKRRLGLRATYHDPCVLGRRLGIYEEPREVLRRAGLFLTEMPQSKERSFCCGHGYLAFEAYPELADAMAERRVDEALRANVDVLVTACPSCLHGLSGAARRIARALAISDITEVVAEAIR